MNKKLTTILLVAFFMLAMLLGGCNAIIGQGETASEGHRRHIRMAQVDMWMLADDLDRAFQTDRPSRLSDKHVR